MAGNGLEVTVDNTGLVVAMYWDSVQKALEEIGMLAEGHVVGYMTQEHIVDTGRLRNSITHRVDAEAVAVGTNVEYGVYVHMGTSKMEGRPFLTAPVQQHAQEYREIYEKHLKNS